MIGLLDPALFLQRAEHEVVEEFDGVLQACRRHSISLPAIEEYWNDLWSHLGFPLERSLGPIARRALHEVRKLSTGPGTDVPPLTSAAGRAWRLGFRQLFGPQHFPSSWEQRMVAAASRAVASRQEVVMFTRRVLGRNLQRHVAGHTCLDENTRWVLHLQPKNLGHKQVLCVYHPRNLAERWTTRFDYRLPGNQHGERYPFCPPNAWWKGSTVAWRTKSSRYAWLDRHGNGWARPNIPGGVGYHWDVFIESVAMRESVGVEQINVVAFGTPPAEGRAGYLHHVPAEKAGRITETGWHC
jgi:hypothetical protein